VAERQFNLVCFETLKFGRKSHTYDTYRSIGGYDVWEKVLRGELTRDTIIDEIKKSGLRGRGGAGFPTGVKLSFMPRTAPMQKYLVCNSDESEPGRPRPRHSALQPARARRRLALESYAIGATVAYNYIRGEFMAEPIPRFEAALKEALRSRPARQERPRLRLIWTSTPSSAPAPTSAARRRRCSSRSRASRASRALAAVPANFGSYGAPTTINNTQSVASIPTILRKGGQWFADLGVKGSGGTAIFSVSGHVEKPGNYELPLGIPFPELLEIAGGMRHGRKLKAVIPGGSSCPVVPAEKMMALTMDFDTIRAAGSGLGTGATIVMDETTCMVSVLRRLARFYYAESCGQCTPCREGTGWLYRVLTRITQGEGAKSDIDMLVDVANKIEGHTICAFGDAAAWPVQSFIKHFRHEFEYMVEHKGRSIVDDLPSVAA
jgi:NADH-quinone oxidoreductase subunit F